MRAGAGYFPASGTDQDHTLFRMNQCGLVEPDIFISQSNELARQLTAAKQEKERLLAAADDDSIPKTMELLESLESASEYLPRFDGEIFEELIEKIMSCGKKAGEMYWHMPALPEC